MLQLERSIHAIFDRRCALTWRHFITADDEDFRAELEWARQRPGVIKRWNSGGADRFNDPAESCLQALTVAEREYWDGYKDRLIALMAPLACPTCWLRRRYNRRKGVALVWHIAEQHLGNRAPDLRGSCCFCNKT